MTVAFWIVAALIVYSYAGYALLIVLLAGVFGRLGKGADAAPVRPVRATLLIAAHNEASTIRDKLENAVSLETSPHSLEIVVVSDGSTDGTSDVVRAFDHPAVRVIDIAEHVGKMPALNAGVAAIDSDVVVFSDANSKFRQDALRHLLRHFTDAAVGGVCGGLTVTKGRRSWLGRGEALFWAYDNAQKRAESALSGAVSAQGSLYAIRRELLEPLPPAAADDLLNSLRVVAKGRRLVFEPGAITEEAVSGNILEEFGRRVRSTEQGVRGLYIMRGLLNPFRHGFYSLQLFSHKVLRRMTPFLLPVFLGLSLALAPSHPFYAVIAILQVAGYAVVGLALAVPPLRRLPLVSFPTFFVVGHAAMALGVIRFLLGRRTERWRPART